MSNQQDVTFDTPEPIELYIENGRGTVDVTATDTTETTVRITGERAEEFEVRDLDDGVGTHRIAIIAPPRSSGFFGKDPRAEIVVEVPVTSALSAKVGSSDVSTHGRFDDIRIDSGSGDIALDIVDGSTEVKSGSGDVRAEQLAGDAQLGSAQGEVVFTTGSGDLVIGQAASGRVTAKTASGDVSVGVLPGTPVWTDIRTASGRLSSTLPSTGEPAPDQSFLEVRATTASGDVTLHQS